MTINFKHYPLTALLYTSLVVSLTACTFIKNSVFNRQISKSLDLDELIITTDTSWSKIHSDPYIYATYESEQAVFLTAIQIGRAHV